MLRFTKSSPLRVALLLILGVLVLDYAWVRTHPEGFRARHSWDFGVMPRGNACPEVDATGKARTDAGETLDDEAYGWKLTALDGREATLEEHRGHVVFVNVWATWCGPCLSEMPTIQALYDSAAKEGVDFVMVSEEDAPTVKTFVEQEKYSFPVFTTEHVPGKFESDGIPATFIVDKQGAIVHKHVGTADWNTESCRKFLHGLL